MTYLRWGFSILLLLIVLGVFLAPLGPLPGFFIGGTKAEPPGAWPDTTATHEVRLGIPGTPPRVVIIWVVQVAGELHVVGAPDSGWVQMLGQGGPVELRIGDNTYPLTARRVTEGWEPILQAYVTKYEPDYPEIIAGFPPLEEAEGQFALFRLERG